jgi:uncharacterized membrane protein YedE/YeeE
VASDSEVCRANAEIGLSCQSTFNPALSEGATFFAGAVVEVFTPLASLGGGLILGVASAAMLLFLGHVTGISGIFATTIWDDAIAARWRVAFVAGLMAGGMLCIFLMPEQFENTTASPPWLMVIGGGLVGYGTQMGSGCTSGHGICGLGRLSKRSFVAVGVFMFTAFVTVFVTRHLLGLEHF